MLARSVLGRQNVGVGLLLLARGASLPQSACFDLLADGRLTEIEKHQSRLDCPTCPLQDALARYYAAIGILEVKNRSVLSDSSQHERAGSRFGPPPPVGIEKEGVSGYENDPLA